MDTSINAPLLQRHLQFLPADTTSLVGIGSPAGIAWLKAEIGEEYRGLPLYSLPVQTEAARFGSVTALLQDRALRQGAVAQDMERLERLLATAGDHPFVLLVDPSLVELHYAHLVSAPAKRLGHIVVSCNGRPIFWGPPRDTAGITYPGIFFRAGHLVANFTEGGDYLEFGVFDGRTVTLAWQMMNQVREMRFFGFDSFSGICGSGSDEQYEDGTYFSNVSTFLHNMRAAGADMSRVVPVQGEFSRRLRSARSVHKELGLRRCLVAHIDCDVYEAAKMALDFCTDLLVQGSILLFDEFHANQASNNTGERRALAEWLQENPKFEVERWHDYAASSRAFIVHLKD